MTARTAGIAKTSASTALHSLQSAPFIPVDAWKASNGSRHAAACHSRKRRVTGSLSLSQATSDRGPAAQPPFDSPS